MKYLVLASLMVFSISSNAQIDTGDYSGLARLRSAFINNNDTKDIIKKIELYHNVECEARYWAPRFSLPSDFVQAYKCFGLQKIKRVRIYSDYSIEESGYKFKIKKIRVN